MNSSRTAVSNSLVQTALLHNQQMLKAARVTTGAARWRQKEQYDGEPLQAGTINTHVQCLHLSATCSSNLVYQNNLHKGIHWINRQTYAKKNFTNIHMD